MEFKIETGISFRKEIVVLHEDTAKHYGSGLLEVFATPAMIALMENASMQCISGFLPEEWGSVGVDVNIRHLKASPVGAVIQCTATVVEADGRRIVFAVAAQQGEDLIGEGTHTRFIINNRKFMEKLQGR